MTQIRPAFLADCQILSLLHRECFPRGWGMAEFESFYLQDNVVAFIAEDNGKPVGFVFGWMVAGHCELLAIAVIESYRKQGVAVILMQALIDTLINQNIARIYLEVGHKNQAAQALYEHFGFDGRGIRKRYYKHPDGSQEDALTMQLALQSAS